MLKEIFAHLGFEFDAKGAHEAEHAAHSLAHQFEELLKLAKKVGPAVGILEVEHKIFEMTAGFAEGVVQLKVFSEQVGISAQQLQVWRYAANLADVSSEDLDLGMRRLSVGIAESAKGSKEFSAVFAKMGVNVKDSSGKIGTLEDLLPSIVDGFNKIPEGVEQTAAAVQLFGRSGARLIPLLHKGSEGIAEMSAEFGELGDVLSEQTIEQSEEFVVTGKKLNLVFKTLKDRMVMWLVPALTKLGEWVEKGMRAFKDFDKDTQILENGMKIFGLFLTVILIPALWTAVTAVYALLAPFITVAAAVAAAYLILEDLYTLFTGGESEIGERLDQWFGEGSAAKVVAWGQAAVKSFVDWVAAFPPFIEWEDRINAFFGELFDNLAKITWVEFWDSAKAAGQAFLDWVLTIPDKISSAFVAIKNAFKIIPGFGGGEPETIGKGGRSGGAGARVSIDPEKPNALKPNSFTESVAPTRPGKSVRDTQQIQNFLDNVQASAIPATVPAPNTTTHNSTENNVSVGPTTVTIQTPAGTPAKQTAEIGKKVAEVVDNRNRQALQALEFAK